MKSVTSYFNLALFQKNLTRFWPIWSLYFLILFFSLPVTILTRYRDISSSTVRRWILNGATSEGLILAMIFGLLAAMAVFSYLYNSRSAGMIHALPIRREALFLTNYLSGLAFLLLPLAAVFLLALGAEALIGAIYLPALLAWVCVQCFYCLFFYSFAVFCAMFTGNLLALPAFYGILNFLASGVAALVTSLLQVFTLGFTSADGMNAAATWLTPAIKLVTAVRVERIPLGGDAFDSALRGLPVAFGYALAGLVLAGLALLLYRHRHIESAGDIVSVRWVRPVFKYGMAACSALALGVLLYSIFGSYSYGARQPGTLLILMLLCGAAGYFAAEMLLQKSFRAFRKWKGCVAFSLVLILAVCTMLFDLTGFERRIPALDSIASVELYSANSAPYDSGNLSTPEVRDPADIALVNRLHQAIVKDRRALNNLDFETQYEAQPLSDGATVDVQRYGVSSFTITYTLKSGAIMHRNYNIPISDALLADPESPAALLTELVNHQAQTGPSYALINDDREGVRIVNTALTVYDTDAVNYTSTTLTQDDAQAEQLLSAVRADLAAGRIGRRYLIENQDRLTNCYYNDLILTFYIPDRYFSQTEGNYSNTSDVTITLQTTATETLRVLREQGAITDTLILVPQANRSNPQPGVALTEEQLTQTYSRD